ncbi:MAG TPA: hypothetical protein VG675_07025 [Bryobacteraceae bacterium]|nr:hypothetical protein [Bryobacteraceae bacterium]
MRWLAFLIWLLPIASAQDPRDIVRKAIQFDARNEEIARNYTFTERQEQRHLDSSGEIHSAESRTWDVTLLEGSPYRRLVARGDHPLSPSERSKEEEKLKFSNRQRRAETPEQRQFRIAEWKRKRDKQLEPLKELPDAFNFHLAGTESLVSGPAFMIDATPKPGYKPKAASAAYLPKLKFRLWVNQKENCWVKLDAETLGNISFGAILVRVDRGTRLLVEQQHVNNEVWLLKRISLQAAGRVLLFKSFRRDLEITYANYRKFEVDSHVVPQAAGPGF